MHPASRVVSSESPPCPFEEFRQHRFVRWFESYGKNCSSATFFFIRVEQRATCLENSTISGIRETRSSRNERLKRSQRYSSCSHSTPGLAENPICSLKQLFTVTSVNRRYFCSQQGKWIGAESPRMLLQYTSPATVTHSPINFGGRSIDHNVLFCSLVFLPAAFDSIRGCGESIYLSRCHEPPVMDGGCSLTLTPKREAVPRTCPAPATLCFRSWFSSGVFFLLHALSLPFPRKVPPTE